MGLSDKQNLAEGALRRRAPSLLTPPWPLDWWIGRRWRPAGGGGDRPADGDIATRPIAVVTGASRGIGRAIAAALVSRGVPVLIIARGSAALEAAAIDLRALRPGAVVLTLAGDVGDPMLPARLDDSLANTGFHVDILVNNAGLGAGGAFVAMDDHRLDELLATNVTGASRLMHHVLPGMLARGAGAVMNIASLGGYVPGPYQAAYYASKAYLVSLTESVAHEIGGRGVRVGLCVPGPVATGFHATMGAEGAFYRRIVPAISPERVAAAALFGIVYCQRTVVPGLLEKLAWLMLGLLPRRVGALLMGVLLKPRGGETDHG